MSTRHSGKAYRLPQFPSVEIQPVRETFRPWGYAIGGMDGFWLRDRERCRRVTYPCSGPRGDKMYDEWEDVVIFTALAEVWIRNNGKYGYRRNPSQMLIEFDTLEEAIERFVNDD